MGSNSSTCSCNHEHYPTVTDISFVEDERANERETHVVQSLSKKTEAAKNKFDRISDLRKAAYGRYTEFDRRLNVSYQKLRNREDIRANMDAYRADYTAIFNEIGNLDSIHVKLREDCPSKPKYNPETVGLHPWIDCAADDCAILLDVLNQNGISWILQHSRFEDQKELIMHKAS